MSWAGSSNNPGLGSIQGVWTGAEDPKVAATQAQCPPVRLGDWKSAPHSRGAGLEGSLWGCCGCPGTGELLPLQVRCSWAWGRQSLTAQWQPWQLMSVHIPWGKWKKTENPGRQPVQGMDAGGSDDPLVYHTEWRDGARGGTAIWCSQSELCLRDKQLKSLIPAAEHPSVWDPGTATSI